eukprot:c4028_g1_i1 orf=33-371(-)
MAPRADVREVSFDFEPSTRPRVDRDTVAPLVSECVGRLIGETSIGPRAGREELIDIADLEQVPWRASRSLEELRLERDLQNGVHRWIPQTTEINSELLSSIQVVCNANSNQQ